MYAHAPSCTPYLLIALSLYLIDRVARLIKTRYTTARITALAELGMTRVEVTAINSGWRAGQHVRLRVLSWGMGWRGWTEAHPFTIASVSRCPSGEGLVLMVKKAGDWTSSLFDLAQEVDVGEGGSGSRKVKVMITGPYGTLQTNVMGNDPD